jgi:hypothetical protein
MIDRLYRTQGDGVERFVVSDTKDVIAAKQLQVSKLNKTIYAPINACHLSDNSFIGKGYNNEPINIDRIVAWYDKYDEAKHSCDGLNSLVLTVHGEIWDISKGNSCYIVRNLGMIPERIQQWTPKPLEVGTRYMNTGKHIVVYYGNNELYSIDWISSRYDRRLNKRLPEAATGQISLKTFC